MAQFSQIRPALLSDLPELLTLGEKYCDADNAPWDAQRARRAFAPLLMDDIHGVVLVVQADQRLVGYAVVTWGWSIEAGGREALLDEMYVDQPGLGHGSALVEAVMAAAETVGASRVFLETEASSESAREFWLRRGFVVEDSVWLQRRCSSDSSTVV